MRGAGIERPEQRRRPIGRDEAGEQLPGHGQQGTDERGEQKHPHGLLDRKALHLIRRVGAQEERGQRRQRRRPQGHQQQFYRAQGHQTRERQGDQRHRQAEQHRRGQPVGQVARQRQWRDLQRRQCAVVALVEQDETDDHPADRRRQQQQHIAHQLRIQGLQIDMQQRADRGDGRRE